MADHKPDQDDIRRRQLLMSVPCRYCKAEIGQRCVSKSGKDMTNVWGWHAARRNDAVGIELTPTQINRAFGRTARSRRMTESYQKRRGSKK